MSTVSNNLSYNKLVSIIIPIYNCSTFLKECLDSVLAQDYSNLEVILVNDGSTDDSGNICEKYCSQYDNFYLYTTNNNGVSAARNLGISKSKGEYISFLDSDDKLESNFISTLVNHIELNNVDLAMCDFYRDIKNKIYDKSSNIVVLDRTQTIENILVNLKIRGYLWNKLFRRQFIDDLKFDETIHVCEDELFVIEYATKINHSIYINKPLYYYRINANSITFSNFNTKLITALFARDKELILIKDYISEDIYNDKKFLIFETSIHNYFHLKKNMNILKKEKINYFKKLKILIKKHDSADNRKKLNLNYKIFYYLMKLNLL